MRVDAKLAHLIKGHKMISVNKTVFSYSADVQPIENKNQF